MHDKASQELQKPPDTSYLESQVLMQYLSVMSVSFVLVWKKEDYTWSDLTPLRPR